MIERLTWESDFLGLPVARIIPDHLAPENIEEVLRRCREEGFRAVFQLVASDNDEGIRALEQGNFSLVDLRVTLGRKIEGVSMMQNQSIRDALASDLPVLVDLAQKSHKDGKVYHDPGFPQNKADAWYKTWISNSVQGFADQVLVMDVGGVAAGYITIHLDNQNTGRIGLFAVAEDARGRGVGRSLIEAALGWMAGQGCTKASVVTQGRNLAALQVYQKSGFITQAHQYWYHKWFL